MAAVLELLLLQGREQRGLLQCSTRLAKGTRVATEEAGQPELHQNSAKRKTKAAGLFYLESPGAGPQAAHATENI
jgi:hypothetical protein